MVPAGGTDLLAGSVPGRRGHGRVLGIEAVFSVVFSGIVTSDDKKYGPIGVVFALMPWLIAIGVVIILGAVTGIVWQERNLPFRTALKKLRRNRAAPQARKP